MKYLPILCFLMVQNLFGQPMDCATFEKLTEAQQSKLQTTLRMHTTTNSKYGIMESIVEMDAAKNFHVVSKTPKMSSVPENETEMIAVKGISYSKQKGDSLWYYTVMPPNDSAKTMALFKNVTKGKECTIVGTETIDGKLLTIIESSFLVAAISDKPTIVRSWYDLKDSVIKKIEVNQEYKIGLQMKMVYEYGIAVAPIEKPLNALPDSLKPKSQAPKRIAGAYSDRSQMNAGSESEQNPRYKDGQKALLDFIDSNLVYPQAAKDATLQGTVYVKFFVETDGTIKDLQVARGIGSGCDEAAVDVIKKMSGNWKCALNAGKPVRAQFILPIKFKLENTSVKD